MASDTTDWPGWAANVVGEAAGVQREDRRLRRPGQDQRPLLPRARPAVRTTRGRPAWVLAALAFLCGGLVSAAVFTVGWRHQAQRNTAAETALAAEKARNHRLSDSLAGARQAEKRDRGIAARRTAEAKAAASELAQAAASITSQASAASSAAGPVSSGASTVASSADKIANELKNLTTYLTTTPPGQIDAGYVESQATYLVRRLGQLQASGTNVGNAAASFQAAVEKLTRLAASLSTRN